MIASKDLAAAAEGAVELAAIAEHHHTPALDARAGQARGMVLLAEGNPEQALRALRRAWQLWHDLEVPYEAARLRVLIGQACRSMQDQDGAAMELAAARQIFQQLGARPELIHEPPRQNRASTEAGASSGRPAIAR
jgi:hypothetical protein